MASNDLQEQFEARKDDMIDLIKEALKTVGLDDLHLSSIHLNVKRAPVCPPGTTAVFEAVHHPDGSVSYQLVCR
jgi:hypothetical protein